MSPEVDDLHWFGYRFDVYFYARDLGRSGPALLAALRSVDERALPERYGEYEPPPHDFEEAAFLESWGRVLQPNALVGLLWTAQRPWEGGQVLPQGPCTDEAIRPVQVPCLATLVLDHEPSWLDAAPVFDAVAVAVSAEVAVLEPRVRGARGLTLPRSWWLGLPDASAERWWFGPTYATALDGFVPKGAERQSSGALVVASPDWRPPEHLRPTELSDRDLDHLEGLAMRAESEAERDRLMWAARLGVRPAATIPL